jgi:hypothetical protein
VSKPLAPLDPDAFLAWAWRTCGHGTGHPHTVDDRWFDASEIDPQLTRDEVRRWCVRLAALVRRNQRLGLDPWDGMA